MSIGSLDMSGDQVWTQISKIISKTHFNVFVQWIYGRNRGYLTFQCKIGFNFTEKSL